MKILTSPILVLSLTFYLLPSGAEIAHAEDKMHMMQSSPDANKAPYDLQFIDTMIQHHQGAVKMAQMALDKAQNPKIKKMAQNMVDDQQMGIAKIKKMRDKSYANKPEAVNMEMPGMKDSMKGMDMDKPGMMGSMKGMDMDKPGMMHSMKGMGMEKSGQVTNNDFDLNFIKMMIPHHKGAISMSQDALKKASDKDIKDMAQGIIKKQKNEIIELEKIRGEIKK